MNAPGGPAKAFLRRSRDFLWSPRSLISGARMAAEAPLRPEDFRSLTFITDPVCNLCGLPQDYNAGAETVCAACTAKPPRCGRARAALVYDDFSRRPLLDLKRAGRRDGLELLAEADLIVPVPLHYMRLVLRGFDQSASLAQSVGRQAGVRVSVDALTRTRRTPSLAGAAQTGRGRAYRAGG